MSLSTTPITQDTQSGSAAATTTVITPGTAFTAGNIALLGFSSGSTANGITSISQTNVVWTRLCLVQTLFHCEIWMGVISASPGASLTINHNALTGAARCNVITINGHDTATPSVSAGCQATSGTSAAPTSPTDTPASGLNHFFYAISRSSGTYDGPPASVGGGFTILNTPNAGAQFAFQSVASTSGSGYAANFALTGSANWVAAIAEIQAPAPPPPPPSTAPRRKKFKDAARRWL